MINPVYSPSSGMSLMDPGFNRPAKWTKKRKRKVPKSLNLIHAKQLNLIKGYYGTLN
jgi:hypothetical protein